MDMKKTKKLVLRMNYMLKNNFGNILSLNEKYKQYI